VRIQVGPSFFESGAAASPQAKRARRAGASAAPSGTLSGSSPPRMVRFETSIHALSRSGAGVGRAPDGRAAFVPLTHPGDRVRVRVTRERKRFVEAEVEELLEASPERQEPRCPVFGRCGGCAWQHVAPELQWATKLEGLAESLRRGGHPELAARVSPDPAPDTGFAAFPAEQVYGYRNRIQLHGEGERLGFHARGSHEIVEIESCPLATAAVNAALPEVREAGARRFPDRPYTVEVEARQDGEVTTAWNLPHGAVGFRQVHDAQNRILRAWVDARLGEGATLYDLYGGRGNLAELPAARFGTIHCVDAGSPVERPAGLPARIQLHREEVLPWLRARIRETRKARKQGPLPASAAVLDPPRRGLGREAPEIAGHLVALAVHELILVSCDPDAFARDLRALRGAGFLPRELAALDLFPQTKHLESLAFLVAPPA